MKLRSLITLTFALLWLTCAAQAQTTDATAPSLKGFYEYNKRNIVGAAEMMPAEHFSFRPVSEARSFAEILGHITNNRKRGKS